MSVFLNSICLQSSTNSDAMEPSYREFVHGTLVYYSNAMSNFLFFCSFLFAEIDFAVAAVPRIIQYAHTRNINGLHVNSYLIKVFFVARCWSVTKTFDVRRPCMGVWKAKGNKLMSFTARDRTEKRIKFVSFLFATIFQSLLFLFGRDASCSWSCLTQKSKIKNVRNMETHSRIHAYTHTHT